MSPGKIVKHQLQVISEQMIEAHVGFIPLSAQFQLGKLQLWGIDPATTADLWVQVYLVGSGQPVPATAFHFVDTVQQYDGAFIWHIFTTKTNGRVFEPPSTDGAEASL